MLLPALAGVLLSLYLVLHARATNGANGFPLDDPWIHLTYARNLHDHQTFAYFPGDASSQGSTSPLYTMLLALGFSITRNEKVLSYTLGIVFHALFLGLLTLWARRRLGGGLWAALAGALVALDVNVGLLSVSGMETSLFLFLVALAFWARATRRALLTAVSLGLSIWVRPDGLILSLLFALDEACNRRWIRGPAAAAEDPGPGVVRGGGAGLRSAAFRALVPFAGLLAGYFLFNRIVGETWLPSTFGAKTVGYQANPRSLFLAMGVGAAFFRNGWLVLAPFALIAIGGEVWRLAHRRPGLVRPEVGWLLGLPVAYLVLLPFAHRFSRYLVPAVPALAIVGLAGLKQATERTARRRTALSIAVVLIAGALGLQLRGAAVGVQIYSELCRYHQARHERTAVWLREHTSPDAVIATHDIGAIGYYAHRRVIDMAGIVQPAVVRHLHRPDYVSYLAELFQREKVTHLAVLRSWIVVDNVAPLFTADPRPEVMEVFPWTPGKTHLLPERAGSLSLQAENALRARRASAALSMLQIACNEDGRSARLWTLAGDAWLLAERPDQAEECYRRAVALFPEADDPRYRLAVALAQQDKRTEARAAVDPLLRRQPPHRGAEELARRLGS